MKNSMITAISLITKPWGAVISWIATFLVPLVLLFFGLRLLASPFFLDIVYRLPHFPEDTYGFSLDERLKYSNLCLKYITTTSDIDILVSQTFEDGGPLFNERELQHMKDVKDIFLPGMNLGFGITLVFFGFLLMAQRRSWKVNLIAGIRRGGWLTFIMLAAIGIFAALSFWTFFEKFHSFFFEADTWLFLYSDTLIRLFPLVFWQDAVLFLIVFCGLVGLLLGIGLRDRRKRKIF